MAPDQCIFVSATYDMTYEKEVIFGSQIYRGGGICSTLLSIKIRNHYHKYKKKTQPQRHAACFIFSAPSFGKPDVPVRDKRN